MGAAFIEDSICIRQWDWSETSQTVSLFTRGHGIVRGLAKGSRRPKSAYSGGIELLTRGSAGIILRPGSELALITEWDLTATHPRLRRDLRACNAALYMADLIHHMVTDHDPHEALFDTLGASLRFLGEAPQDGEAPRDIAPALLTLQWAALAETGYRPELNADVRTGEAVDNAGGKRGSRALRHFSAALGGLVTPAPADETGSWRVRPQTIALLRAVAARNAADGPAWLAAEDPAAVMRAARLLAAYTRHVLGREPRSMPVVFGSRLPR